MREWSPADVEREFREREANWKRGVCPDSGMEIHRCHRSVCDCFGAWDCKTCGSDL